MTEFDVGARRYARRELDLAVNLRVFTRIGSQAGTHVAVVRENAEGVAVHQGTDAAMLLRHLGERAAGDALGSATLAVAGEHGTAIVGAEPVARAAAVELMAVGLMAVELRKENH